MTFLRTKLPRLARNLLHLEGRTGLIPRFSADMGVRGFLLNSRYKAPVIHLSRPLYDFELHVLELFHFAF